MSFTLYALLTDDSPCISNATLAMDLRNFFSREKDFSLDFEQLPFATHKSLALRWGRWLVRVSYEEGEEVVQDSESIQKILGPNSRRNVNNICRRVRMVFGSDEAREYTNQIIYLLDFFKEMDGILIFDPRQGEIIE